MISNWRHPGKVKENVKGSKAFTLGSKYIQNTIIVKIRAEVSVPEKKVCA